MHDTVLGVLVSGRGSNLQAIIDAIEQNSMSAKIGVVISDKPDAAALQRARQYNIPAVCIERKKFPDKQAFEQAVADELRQHNVELIVLAGFMRILSPFFIHLFTGRIMNIHPALLPSFPGLNAQQQAIEYGAKLSGCTVHFVDEGMDTGPIILQQAVPVYSQDTEDSLAQRILRQEHIIYPQAIQLYIQGRLHIEGRKVIILPENEGDK